MKALVVGFGSIGKRHARNLVDILGEEVSVFDIASLDFSSINRELASKINVIHDYQALKKSHFDVAIICTPNSTHLKYMEELGDKGTHLLIEKPISSSLDGVRDVLERIGSKGIINMVACNLRFHPAAVTIKKIMNGGDMGKLYFVHSEYGNYLPYQRTGVDYKKVYAADNREGGIILDAIHEINLLRWFVDEVIECDCWGYYTGSLDIAGYDLAFAILKFSSGVVTEMRVDCLQKSRRRFYEFVFEKGTILWESTGKSPEFCEVRLYNDNQKMWKIIYKDSGYDLNKMYVEELRYFIECVNKGEKTCNSGWEGLRDLEVALTFLQKASERSTSIHGIKP